MDDIFDKFRQNFDEVKKREASIAEQEAALRQQHEELRQSQTEANAVRVDYESKLAALEREKEAMAGGPVASDDIVTVNVQGEKFSTLRGTLTQFHETKLAYMFNGRWSSELRKDAEGNTFLDLPPALFRKFLDYLTIRRMAGNEWTSHPVVPQAELPQFRVMLIKLGVEGVVYGHLSCLSTRLKSPFIQLTADGMCATNTSAMMGYVLGEDVYRNEKARFELQIEKLSNSWMFFGVMCDDSTKAEAINDRSFYGNPTAYGWADRGGLWTAGTRQPESACTIPLDVLSAGRQIVMELDGTSHPSTLSIRVLPLGHVQTFSDLPGGHAWRLHLNLVECNDSVRLISAERSTLSNGT